MDVELRRWESPENRPMWKDVRCSISPDGKWAVAELFRGELYAAGRVLCRSGDRLTVEFLQAEASFDDAVPDARSWEVRWEWLRFGFFKIVCRELDSGACRVRRVYVDRALYEKQVKMRHSGDSGAKPR